MSVIEDTRKLLQDFLAPELRELAARVNALEERMEARFASIEQRFNQAERAAEDRHSQTLQAIARLADVYELRERISRIEAREKTN
jgi:hypothetical protein